MVYLYEFKIVIHVDDISDAHREIYDIPKEGYCIADSDENAYKIAQKAALDWDSKAEVKYVERKDYIITKFNY